MLSVDIPGFRRLELGHLVLDYNGTLAINGLPLLGVREELKFLANDFHIHVITADTHGRAANQLEGSPITLTILPEENQADLKLRYIHSLGVDSVVAIGNGRNDRLMLEAAAVGIAVIQREGASAAAILSADIVMSSVLEAFDLLRNPKRLISTLRS